MVSFPELLQHLRAKERRIVVTGTHGKTTTTSLISWLLETAGLAPDFVIGMVSRNFGTSVRLNQAKVMVVEGDEYAASALDQRSKFDFYDPNIAVVTSLEWIIRICLLQLRRWKTALSVYSNICRWG